MTVQQEGSQRIIVFDLKELGVEPGNWQRLALNLRGRTSVSDAYVERGHRPGVHEGILRVYPNLTRVPVHQQEAARQALDKVVADTIAHRVANPERYIPGEQLIPLS